MSERLSDERVRAIAEDGWVWIEPFGDDINPGVGHENWPSKEAAALAREVLELRAEVDDLKATVQAAWIDGYMDRSRPNPSRVTVAIAYDKVNTMPDALMLRQLWGDPRKPTPRGVLSASHDATLAAPHRGETP